MYKHKQTKQTKKYYNNDDDYYGTYNSDDDWKKYWDNYGTTKTPIHINMTHANNDNDKTTKVPVNMNRSDAYQLDSLNRRIIKEQTKPNPNPAALAEYIKRRDTLIRYMNYKDTNTFKGGKRTKKRTRRPTKKRTRRIRPTKRRR